MMQRDDARNADTHPRSGDTCPAPGQRVLSPVRAASRRPLPAARIAKMPTPPATTSPRCALLALLAFSLLPASAAWKMPPVHEKILSNGMTILVIERRASPTFHAHIGFRAGSAYEKPGESGMAHMLEHMLFKGTRVMGTRNYAAEEPLMARLDQLYEQLDAARAAPVPDASRIEDLAAQITSVENEQQQYIRSEELWSLYQQNGGENLNASTSRDITNYFLSLPANRLELWAWLESDRMQAPVFREFYRERDVIAEERRMRVEADPGGVLWEALFSAAYTAHPYRIPTIGYMSDIENYKRPAVERFHTLNYAPNRAVVVLVGDLSAQKAFAVCEKYFGRLARQPDPPPILPREPEQRGERRVQVLFDAEPHVMVAYHVPPTGHPDLYALEVLAGLLSEGRTSRLYKSLVRTQEIAVSAHAFALDGRDPGLFIFSGAPRHPHTAEEVEKAFYAELAGLIHDPIDERELQKVKNNLQADFIRGLGTNMGMAHALGYYAVIADWRYLETFLDRINAIAAEDVKRVARQYLTPANRTVAIRVKEEKS
ncbi:insulinase family protein [bacterium]|nr:insulinase family protein [bacterium]